MIYCPNCHKPVSGRPRACGYCGFSLVQEYFKEQPHTTNEVPYPSLGAGGVAAAVFGSFGALSVLGALVFQLLPLFQGQMIIPDDLTIIWWARMLALAVLPSIYLVQQLVLHGLRFSLLFDGFWLFASVAGLGFAVQAYLAQGTNAFGGIPAVTYLLALGCILAVVSCMIGIFSYRRSV